MNIIKLPECWLVFFHQTELPGQRQQQVEEQELNGLVVEDRGYQGVGSQEQHSVCMEEVDLCLAVVEEGLRLQVAEDKGLGSTVGDREYFEQVEIEGDCMKVVEDMLNHNKQGRTLN